MKIFTDVLGTSATSKLLRNYESALINKEELEINLKDLREQLKILHIEKDKLEWLLAHANNTFPQLTSTDNRNVENVTINRQSVAKFNVSGIEQQKSQNGKKKSLQEHIVEWSKVSAPDKNFSFSLN